jgi:hypothetical protein
MCVKNMHTMYGLECMIGKNMPFNSLKIQILFHGAAVFSITYVPCFRHFCEVLVTPLKYSSLFFAICYGFSFVFAFFYAMHFLCK